ncbi:hypothetical protein MTBLM5_450011 [Magnetospirillum sp. LM-5]|uniref:hypothetical protein n=1 Tax=Magnetospirillum sp. LM-5 TaxID=2681466 RepID=UPI00138293C8|nr:hypothetical protein [Magnetospirillum sp. LM-5]CAA7622194.1 hypothetical protein MTBLM5_450011 [Magnetospirillum sp. LM-5]
MSFHAYSAEARTEFRINPDGKILACNTQGVVCSAGMDALADKEWISDVIGSANAVDLMLSCLTNGYAIRQVRVAGFSSESVRCLMMMAPDHWAITCVIYHKNNGAQAHPVVPAWSDHETYMDYLVAR